MIKEKKQIVTTFLIRDVFLKKVLSMRLWALFLLLCSLLPPSLIPLCLLLSLGQGCQTGGRRRNILWAPVRVLRHSANAWPPNLAFEKIVLQKKKSFKMKSCHKVMVDNRDLSNYRLRQER